jgi:hypothetical protein
VKINETESRKVTEETNKSKRWFFENINIIGEPLAKLPKEQNREDKN